MNGSFEQALAEFREELEQAFGREISYADLGKVLVAVGDGLQVSVEVATRAFVDTCLSVWPESEKLVRRHLAGTEGAEGEVR